MMLANTLCISPRERPTLEVAVANILDRVDSRVPEQLMDGIDKLLDLQP